MFSTTSKAIKEPTFVINNFDLPDEKMDADRWIELIRALIFMEKGMYSDAPDCGVHIRTYEFKSIIDDKNELESEIRRQCSTYLSDIPIGDLFVNPVYLEDQNVWVVQIIVGFQEGSIVTHRAINITDEDGVLSDVISKFDIK